MDFLTDIITWSPAALGTLLLVALTLLLQVRKMCRDLHEWHNKEDDDGVKIWYVRRSLEEAITKLSESIDLQTTLLTRLIDRVENMERRDGPR